MRPSAPVPPWVAYSNSASTPRLESNALSLTIAPNWASTAPVRRSQPLPSPSLGAVRAVEPDDFHSGPTVLLRKPSVIGKVAVA